VLSNPKQAVVAVTTLSELLERRVESPAVRRLLLAAVDSFWRDGFHAASTRAIAKRANLSPAAVYVHFESKEQLLFTIILVVAEHLLERLTATAREEGTPTERLKRLVGDYVEVPAEMYKASLVANTEFAYLSPAQRRQILKIRDALATIVQACLEQGCAAGEFRIDDISLTRTAIIAFCRSVLTWYSPRGKLSPRQIGQQFAEYVNAMVQATS
jgi:AcrR family transcriptional regulator